MFLANIALSPEKARLLIIVLGLEDPKYDLAVELHNTVLAILVPSE